jgi:hypothetical protein
MADKLTIQDYLDYFGDKSAMSDDVLDQLFGTIKSRGDYMESQRGQAMTPEMMQIIMGAVEPGGGIKALGKAAAKGGKNIVNIFRELIGKGKPEMGDVLAGFQRRSQPSEFIGQTTPGQQVLKLLEDSKQATKLPAQDLPIRNLTQSPTSSRTPEQNVVRDIMRAISRESREVGARSPESYFSRMMTYDDFLEILRKAGK